MNSDHNRHAHHVYSSKTIKEIQNENRSSAETVDVHVKSPFVSHVSVAPDHEVAEDAPAYPHHPPMDQQVSISFCQGLNSSLSILHEDYHLLSKFWFL